MNSLPSCRRADMGAIDGHMAGPAGKKNSVRRVHMLDEDQGGMRGNNRQW